MFGYLPSTFLSGPDAAGVNAWLGLWIVGVLAMACVVILTAMDRRLPSSSRAGAHR